MANRFITSAASLVTTYEQTRTGFMRIALEKNAIADPHLQNVEKFRALAAGAACPEDLLTIPEIRPFLLAASGLSDKSMQYLKEEDQTKAIEQLIATQMKSVGDQFMDEIISRYLLTKGDALGGTLRNRIGEIGQEKLVTYILSALNAQNITYDWLSNEKRGKWKPKAENDSGIAKNLKALHWQNQNGHRVLGFNLKIPVVSKNIDICLFNCDTRQYKKGKIKEDPAAALMMGELKGGFDPAGADEHWKTANTALQRIRDSFAAKGIEMKTSFVGAAIASAMAQEIYDQLQNETLSNAANLNDNNQLVEYCNWLIAL